LVGLGKIYTFAKACEKKKRREMEQNKTKKKTPKGRNFGIYLNVSPKKFLKGNHYQNPGQRRQFTNSKIR